MDHSTDNHTISAIGEAMKKLLQALCICGMIAGFWMEYGPSVEWSAPSISWPWASKGAIDSVVVIEESSDRTPATAAVLSGKTVAAIHKAGKFKRYEPNDLPPKIGPVVGKMLTTAKPPFVLLFRGNSPGKPIALPDTDAEFAELLQKNGGF